MSNTGGKLESSHTDSQSQNSDDEHEEFLRKTVGGEPVIKVIFGGIETLALIDTGSQVTMISQAFYENYMKPFVDKLLTTGPKYFTLTAANGLEVPYLGFLMLNVTIQGQNLPEVGVLVIKNIPGSKEMREEIPGVIGMNVLQHLSDLPSVLYKHSTVPLDPTESATRFVRVAGCETQIVQAGNITCIPVRVSGQFKGSKKKPLFIEPFTEACQGCLYLSPSLIDVDSKCMIPVVNLNRTKDVVLEPGTRIGIATPVELGTDKKLEVKCYSNEIKVNLTGLSHEDVEDVRSLNGDKEEILSRIDLSHLVGTMEQMHSARQLFKKHKDVFSATGEQLGCTSTIQHKIVTTDDVPVRQPYRRIPPQLWKDV